MEFSNNYCPGIIIFMVLASALSAIVSFFPVRLDSSRSAFMKFGKMHIPISPEDSFY
jgi:hypothetical protein